MEGASSRMSWEYRMEWRVAGVADRKWKPFPKLPDSFFCHRAKLVAVKYVNRLCFQLSLIRVFKHKIPSDWWKHCWPTLRTETNSSSRFASVQVLYFKSFSCIESSYQGLKLLQNRLLYLETNAAQKLCFCIRIIFLCRCEPETVAIVHVSKSPRFDE